MQKITNRMKAVAAGERFYAGKLCPKGHEGIRYVIGGKCIDCAKVESRSEHKKQYDKRYHAEPKNKSRRMDSMREWVSNNQEISRSIKRNYKMRRRAQVKGGVSSAELREWRSAQKKICHWCGVKCDHDFHADHYIPLAKGGMHETDNLVIACAACNVKKNAKDPYEFAASLGRLF